MHYVLTQGGHPYQKEGTTGFDVTVRMAHGHHHLHDLSTFSAAAFYLVSDMLHAQASERCEMEVVPLPLS